MEKQKTLDPRSSLSLTRSRIGDDGLGRVIPFSSLVVQAARLHEESPDMFIDSQRQDLTAPYPSYPEIVGLTGKRRFLYVPYASNEESAAGYGKNGT